MDQPLWRMPIFNQGPEPLCWDYAGVELAEAWRRSHWGQKTIGHQAFVFSPRYSPTICLMPSAEFFKIDVSFNFHYAC
jgi:hypothetical protein